MDKCSANVQKCSAHCRQSYVTGIQEKKWKISAQHVATNLLQLAYAVGKVLPTQETETIQVGKSLLLNLRSPWTTQVWKTKH